MLFILFHIGKDRYAIDSRQVKEVVPMVDLKKLPQAPAHIAGLFRYRGRVVPVIDLCALIGNGPCRDHLSTRIILVDFPAGATGASHILGIMAERIVETISVSKADLAPSGIALEEAPFFGKIILSEQEMIQSISVENLLPESLRSALFKEEAEMSESTDESLEGKTEPI